MWRRKRGDRGEWGRLEIQEDGDLEKRRRNYTRRRRGPPALSQEGRRKAEQRQVNPAAKEAHRDTVLLMSLAKSVIY